MTPALEVPGYYRRLREAAAFTSIAETRRDTSSAAKVGGHAELAREALTEARTAMAAGDTARALSAVQRALVLDVVSGDAYELLLELSRVRELPPGPTARRVLAGLHALDSGSPSIRGMLDLGLLMQDAYFARVASAGPDPVSADAVLLHATPAGAEKQAALGDLRSRRSPADFWRAAIIGAAWSRDLDLLGSALEDAEADWIPLNTLRRAIRTTLADADHDLAAALLALYRRDRPQDRWASEAGASVEDLPRSDLAIARNGFPYSPRSRPPSSAAGGGASITALYALHNSFPEHTSGYAVRSQALVNGLHERGIAVHPVTRLGYPTDLDPERWPESAVPRQETIGTVTYQRLLLDGAQMKQSPIAPYVRRYADHLVDHARTTGAQILHGASNHINGFAVTEAARRLGVPSIYEVRGLWEVTRSSRDPQWGEGPTFLRLSALEAQAAAGADHVITITGGLADELVRRGVDRRRISVVPNGVDPTQFTPDPMGSSSPGEIPTIGYIGSLISYEGLETLLEAAVRLRRRRIRFRIVIVGDGTAKSSLEARSRELGVQDVVHFPGRVPHEEVGAIYRRMDVMVYPRLPLPVCRMVSPLKPFEAMAMGKCVIVSDVEPLTEIVENNRTGLVHRAGDAASLAKMLRRALRSGSVRARLGKNAAEAAHTEHDWRHRADQLADIYRSLVMS